VGKTWKDVKAFDIKRHKQGSREATLEMDLRTRTKPLKKAKRGPKNLVRELDSLLEEEYENKYTEDSDENF